MRVAKEVIEYFNSISKKENMEEAQVLVEGEDIHTVHDIDNIFIDSDGNIRITLDR